MIQTECEEYANVYDDGSMDHDAGTENQSLSAVKSGDEIVEGEQLPLAEGLRPEAARTSASSGGEHQEARLVQHSQQTGPDSGNKEPKDVLQIRGGARQRLWKLQQTMEQLKDAICLDTEETVLQALELLRFCGVALPESSDVLQELEHFLRQLGDFVRVFAQHWKQVQSELPRYQKLFANNLEAQQASQAA